MMIHQLAATPCHSVTETCCCAPCVLLNSVGGIFNGAAFVFFSFIGEYKARQLQSQATASPNKLQMPSAHYGRAARQGQHAFDGMDCPEVHVAFCGLCNVQIAPALSDNSCPGRPACQCVPASLMLWRSFTTGMTDVPVSPLVACRL